MAKKGKLLVALDAHKGRDYRLEKQKKQEKQAVKKKHPNGQGPDGEEKENIEARPNATTLMPEDESDGWDSDKGETTVNVTRIIHYGSDSGSDNGLDGEDAESSMPLEADNQDGIPFSDIETLASEEKVDLLPHQRLTISNATGLAKVLKRIALPSDLPFSSHQSITTTEPVAISDVNDDLARELTFYSQSLDAVKEARTLLKKEDVPFSRPTDYFAEMVKSDEHMGKVKSRMVEEAASERAAADARKQRDLKRFGKQVQVAKVQERNKAKRETLNKIKLLKRKRKNTDTATADEEGLFDVELEDAAGEKWSSKSAKAGDGIGRTQNKRQKKNDKHGFGGKKRFSKSTDAASTAELHGFSAKKMKRKGRLGKSRRKKL